MLAMWESRVQRWAPHGWAWASVGWERWMGLAARTGLLPPRKRGSIRRAQALGREEGPSDERTSARRAWCHPLTTSPGAGGLLKFQTNHSNTFIVCPLPFSAGQCHCIGSFRVTFFNGNLLPYTPGSEVTPVLGSCPEVRRKCLCYLCQRTSCLCFFFFI